jgi:hypothetical protein
MKVERMHVRVSNEFYLHVAHHALHDRRPGCRVILRVYPIYIYVYHQGAVNMQVVFYYALIPCRL